MVGLSTHTEDVFHRISALPCLQNYTLVGGTGIALQLGHRLSEDLDFCAFKQYIAEKLKIDFGTIKKELQSVGNIDTITLAEDDQIDLIFEGVKLTFFTNDFTFRELQRVQVENNIYVANPLTAGIMKVYVLPYRAKFRDYYDIYSLMQAGISLCEMVEGAHRLDRFQFHTKNYLAKLTDGQRYEMDENFALLQPKYHVTAQDIERVMIEHITTEFAQKYWIKQPLELDTQRETKRYTKAAPNKALQAIHNYTQNAVEPVAQKRKNGLKL
jgi:hypothetical protein